MTRQRCAVYTRKSTEEGLDQAFNSLDAQFDACAAFVRSQKAEGWRLVGERYDDGGYSGGSIDRPALQRLLDDIRGRKVDVVVVYKIDRLTRSLTDFARIVEQFESHGVSFVSVTQQFNTTSSMGRLTLNVLLSFAQFEREVTAERIRDKIAASKMKGMWMGGPVPLGYDAQDKKLVVNQAEADVVRALFEGYLRLGSVRRLKEEADRRRLVTKSRRSADGASRGGQAFTRGHLYQLLRNPLYAGRVRHQGATFQGLQEPIVDETVWDAVQAQLDRNAAPRAQDTNLPSRHLLTGLVFDDSGDRLSPSHANKNGRRYRYYVSHRLMRESRADADGWRLPADELERAVLTAIVGALRDERALMDLLAGDMVTAEDAAALRRRSTELVDRLQHGRQDRKRQILVSIIQGIDVHRDRLVLSFFRAPLNAQLLGRPSDESNESDPTTLTVPVTLKRRGVEAKLVLGQPSATPSTPNPVLIAVLARAHRWFACLTDGSYESIQELARHESVDAADVSHALSLVFLAPDVIEAILAGRQAVELTGRRLKHLADLPDEWDSQRRMLLR